MAEIAFNPIYLKQNKGLGNALRVALSNASTELVARMDSDDISYPERFELQLRRFKKDPAVDIVGGNITEFIGNPDHIVAERTVHTKDAAIKEDMKKRCAMNHVAVMYKKSSVQRVGGYKDWPWNEDYYLWLRMIRGGCKFENVPYDLVNVRTGEDMSSRRGGWKYFRSEQLIQKYMLDHKMISFPRYLYNVAIRFGGEVVASNSLRGKLFKFTRTQPSKKSMAKKNFKHNKQIDYPPFSVAMSVYGKDNAEWFDIALNSIIDQTVKPSEIVLVVDGPVPQEIQTVIEKYKIICSGGGIAFKAILLPQNHGLGNALRIAVNKAENEIIARMDSDDIALPNRFEMQLRILVEHPEIDIIGGNITEFIGSVDNKVGQRKVPVTDHGIKEYMKKRCPFNHMTVMYRKAAVLRAGGYKDLFWNEDYWLWIRMAEKDCQMANTGTTLVNVRVGKDMYSRRGGRKYFDSELFLQRYMLKKKIINKAEFIDNVSKRYILQVMMPNSVRGWIFRNFARTKA